MLSPVSTSARGTFSERLWFGPLGWGAVVAFGLGLGAVLIPVDTLLASSLIGRVWKTTWRALKLLPSGPAAVSALARLDETVLSRWLCALTALPETWKILSRDIIAP